MNLYKETINKLKDHGKTLDDVLYICGDDFQITKENFIEISNIEYDAEYGAAEVAQDLKLIGKDFWLSRGEYDGSEWWDYHKRPNPEELPIKKILALTIDQSPKGNIGWQSLSELNDFDEHYDEEQMYKDRLGMEVKRCPTCNHMPEIQGSREYNDGTWKNYIEVGTVKCCNNIAKVIVENSSAVPKAIEKWNRGEFE